MRQGMRRQGGNPWAWLAIVWAALLIVPWYGLEGGLFSGGWAAHSGSAMPALWQGLGEGRPWLLGLLLPALLASFAGGTTRRRPKLMVAAGLLGLGWLLLEACDHRRQGVAGRFHARHRSQPTGAGLGRAALCRRSLGYFGLRPGLAGLVQRGRVHRRRDRCRLWFHSDFRRLPGRLHPDLGLSRQRRSS